MAGNATAARLRSYGRRKAKTLTPRQERLWEELLPRLRIALRKEGSLDPQAIFSNMSELWLEIGFGGGEHLAAQAERHPEIGMIGAEPFTGGIAKVLVEIETRALGNIRLYDDDVRALLDRLPAASLDRVYILFPDPWPKARHHKRRLINPETLTLLAYALKPGGMLCLATDHADYAEWMLLHLLADARFVWTARTPEDFRDPPEGWVETRYQQKAAAEGRKPVFLLFRRHDASVIKS